MASKKTVVMREPGKPPISFHKGGLHESLGVPQGQTIPPDKMRAAEEGRYGPKAQKQAEFALHVLKQAHHPGSA